MSHTYKGPFADPSLSERACKSMAQAISKLPEIMEKIMTTPAPQPLTLYHLSTYVDGTGRIVIGKTKLSPQGTVDFGAVTEYVGQGQAMVNTPQGPQPVPFEIPLPGPSLAEAFDQMDKLKDQAWIDHVQRAKRQALGQRVNMPGKPG